MVVTVVGRERAGGVWEPGSSVVGRPTHLTFSSPDGTTHDSAGKPWYTSRSIAAGSASYRELRFDVAQGSMASGCVSLDGCTDMVMIDKPLSGESRSGTLLSWKEKRKTVLYRTMRANYCRLFY